MFEFHGHRPQFSPRAGRTSPLPVVLLFGAALFAAVPGRADRVSPLADSPDWSSLDIYQGTILRDEFVAALSNVYTHGTEWKLTIQVFPDRAEIVKRHQAEERYTLSFRPDDSDAPPSKISRFWRTPTELPPLRGRPVLSDLHIALDPGHIGGKWAKMEERWFTIGDGVEIKEGESTLEVAKILKAQLEELGARVTLVRGALEPAGHERPTDFHPEARRILRAQGIWNPRLSYKEGDSRIASTVQWQSEKIFYRTHEIRARSQKVNAKIKPDLCLCLHLNAATWGDPADPQLTAENHLHILVNGTYSAGELTYDDQRFTCLQRLLQRIHDEENALSLAVAPALTATTKLPPYIYLKRNARRINASPYVWARNLLANRIYTCPVLYFEPYVMNNSVVYHRLSAGDYLGRSRIAGRMRSSLFQDYVRGIVDGLTGYYKARRKP